MVRKLEGLGKKKSDIARALLVEESVINKQYSQYMRKLHELKSQRP